MKMRLTVPGGVLEGELAGLRDARGVVVFAHGSGSSRFSPHNQAVALGLQRRGLATLLMDLLTPEEASSTENTFNIELLADRLLRGVDWLGELLDGGRLPTGLFGASTGAAAALTAAAQA